MSPRSAEALRLVAATGNDAPRAHQGGCTCPSPKWADCECGWGELIDALLRLAYSESTTHEDVARQLPPTVMRLRSRAADALGDAVTGMPGTTSEKARKLSVSTERIKDILRRVRSRTVA